MMDMVDLFGKNLKYKYCTEADIETHFASISDAITDMTAEEFKARMLDCVKAKTAFSTEDDDCFLYYLNTEKRSADGIAISGGNSPIKMLALLSGIFHKIDHDTLGIYFKLHSGKVMKEYKSLLSKVSMQRYGVTNKPLIVRIDHLRDKIKKLYSYRGLPV